MSIEARIPNLHLPEVRVRHPLFFSNGPFIEDVEKGFPKSKSLYVDQTLFRDGTHWLKTIIGRKGRESELKTLPRYKAIVPFWISTQFGDDAQVILGVEQLINSLTHTERSRKALVDEVDGVCPYLEMRQDKDGSGADGDRDVGEAINAQVIARALKGMHKLAVLGPHSFEGVSYLKAEGIDVLSITAAPLFAEHIIEKVFARDGFSARQMKTRGSCLDNG